MAKYLQDGKKILDGSTDLSTAWAGYAFHNITYQRSKNEAYSLRHMGTNIYLLGLKYGGYALGTRISKFNGL